jgi:hypothetical protein
VSLAAETARWFEDRRGIRRDTLEAFGITTEGDGVSIPYPDGVVKHRASLEKVEVRPGKLAHRMWFDPTHPDGQPPFLPPNFQTGSHLIVFEGETDTMAAWQAAPSDAKPHVLGLPGANAFGPKGFTPERIQALFGDAKHVFFVLDNEDPYVGNEAHESVERGWKQIKEKLGRKAHRVVLPGNVQDACEFFGIFDWAAFRVLLEDAMKAKYHFAALDLTRDPPDYDWLVENFMAKGDISLLIGDGGVGKSWITLDLAVHMAMGKERWLDMALDGRKVMVIDQENPEVTVRQRLHALGLRPEHVENLRYVWYQNVLLDNAEQVSKLYDDVTTFEPDLLVIDSLSRVHLRNENANEEMNPLINGAIYPIARQMGVTVAMIHHVAKAGGSRGATAIRNAVDLCLDVSNTEDEKWQIIRPDKLRSVAPWGYALYTRRVEDDQGNVTLVTEDDVMPV